MIRISQIDDEFSIYKNKTVVLWGIGPKTKYMIDTFRYHGLEIEYIYSDNYHEPIELFEGIPVVSYKDLKNSLGNLKDDITVQISIPGIDKGIISKIELLGFNNIITFDEADFVFTVTRKMDMFRKKPDAFEDYKKAQARGGAQRTKTYDFINQNPNDDEFIFICSVPKTGDCTLIDTFIFKNIKHNFTFHTISSVSRITLSEMPQKFKIIMGVREPIAKDLSGLYQLLVTERLTSTVMFKYYQDDIRGIFQNGGDVQRLFTSMYDETESYNSVHNFVERFSNSVLDLSKYPFDKEKGYTIAKDGNIEVFVYQLEKMNNIVEEMSDWIGQAPFDKWVIANEASGKWIADSYEKAKKEIKISREYFDRTYNSPWIKHFYSTEDIERFKERWRPHISDDI